MLWEMIVSNTACMKIECIRLKHAKLLKYTGNVACLSSINTTCIHVTLLPTIFQNILLDLIYSIYNNNSIISHVSAFLIFGKIS
ncbi:hypothetical protein LDENG_00103590 [Lucifuga dentata]|nr:hypothetical protein LDENG_00103590 [Lucifuga dentata]